jgi:glutamine cyclotransferase
MDEGWGLTHDDHYLYASDGTDMIHFFSPSKLNEAQRHIRVRDLNSRRRIYRVNELELVGDHIYAN